MHNLPGVIYLEILNDEIDFLISKYQELILFDTNIKVRLKATIIFKEIAKMTKNCRKINRILKEILIKLFSETQKEICAIIIENFDSISIHLFEEEFKENNH